MCMECCWQRQLHSFTTNLNDILHPAPTQVVIAGSHPQYKIFATLPACRFPQEEFYICPVTKRKNE